MRRLLSSVFGPRANPSGPQSGTRSRRVRLSVEPLEGRLLLNGAGVITGLMPPDVLTALDGPTKRTTDVQMGLPLLDSKPDAPATLYLDFTGNFESDWWNYDDHGNPVHFHNVTTPAFDTDGNPASFSADEKALITQIWSRVAEDYAPFNINVSTDYYGSFNDRQALKVAVGGDNTDWLHQDASGISAIGSFTNSAPNVVFVFNLVA